MAGTPWRIVIKDPQSELYGFLNGPGRWVAWLALAGLGVAGLAIILLIAGLARQRDQLIVQSDELALLAAVDPLTGLRNRGVSARRAQRRAPAQAAAVAARDRRGSIQDVQ